MSPPPPRLSQEKTWFFPALAYSMVGLDKSLFSLFEAGIDCMVEVTTHQCQHPLVKMERVNAKDYPWFGILQGVDHVMAQPFVDYIETFIFREQDPLVEWKLRSESVRMADPFVDGVYKTGVTVVMLLPVNLTTKCETRVIVAPGLRLSTPLLGVRSLTEV